MAVLPGRASAKAAPHVASEIRVYNDFRLPFEPTTLVSMSEYNLSLCIFSSLFTLDDASVAHSDILESWRYDDKRKAYLSVIKDGIVWSDGKPFTTDDIIVSILRLKAVSDGFYNSVASLFSDQSSAPTLHHHPALEVLGPKTLAIHVRAPGPDLANRLVAVSMVRTNLIDPSTHRVSSHAASLGPYIVDPKASNVGELHLVANDHFFAKTAGMAQKILLRPYDGKLHKADDVVKPATGRTFSSTALLPLRSRGMRSRQRE